MTCPKSPTHHLESFLCFFFTSFFVLKNKTLALEVRNRREGYPEQHSTSLLLKNALHRIKAAPQRACPMCIPLDRERPFFTHWGAKSSRNCVSNNAAPTVVPHSGQSLFHNRGRKKNKFLPQCALRYSNAREPNKPWHHAIRAIFFFLFLFVSF